MSDGDAGRRLERQRLLARVEHDREQLAGTVDELRRPLQNLRRLQENTRAIAPALFAAGLAFLVVRALRGSGSRRIGKSLAAGHPATYPVVYAARRTSWFAMVLQCISAYRSARLLGAALRSGSHPAAVAPRRTLAPEPAGRAPSTFERYPT